MNELEQKAYFEGLEKRIQEEINGIKRDYPFLDNNPYKQRNMSRAEFLRKAAIVNEHEAIINSTKNKKIIIISLHLCTNILYELCACFPDNRQIAESLSAALDALEEPFVYHPVPKNAQRSAIPTFREMGFDLDEIELSKPK
ncbi:MAG: hypothetical protein HQK81_10920 [Desulfovibrionaceae bacterium]|nr:hypothetical protein [Desulfovibrionaceae bacterium]MBF0514553.1 hypothetical protein [Desulfovibrionaceae bacterium]